MTVESEQSVDICVVGGGPAGLLITRQLAEQGRDVVLLESGDDAGEEDAGALSRGEVAGDKIYALDLVATRHRGLGGNANLWLVKTDRDSSGWNYGLRYGTLTELAMADRPWVDGSGWPLAHHELDRWYRTAHEMLALGPFGYDDEVPEGGQAPWLDPALFDRREFRFGHRDLFLNDLRSRLQASPRVRIVPGATVTQLHQSRSGAPADRLTYADARGERHELRPQIVVLATGGVENARLLLNSEPERGGIGNETDNVGRYFMDHPLFTVGDIKLTDNHILNQLTFFDHATRRGGPRHGHVVTSRSWCEANESVEIAVAMFPRPKRPVVIAIDAAKAVVADPTHYATRPRELASAVARALPGLPHLPRAGYMSVVGKQSLLPGFGRGGWSADPMGMGFSELEVIFQCEQAPLRDSRVTLADERDRFGSPLPKLTWVMGAQTRESVLRLQRHIADNAASAGVGTFVPRSGSLDQVGPPTSIAHHIGTTRMSRSPADGVVDGDCRVHTCPNLYIAGSSVFPTSSYVNPTLTIAALAMRLAATLTEHR